MGKTLRNDQYYKKALGKSVLESFMPREKRQHY